MRPIDADALLKGKEDHEMISTHLIFNAPTLDVKPVIRGKWLSVSNATSIYSCSKCGRIVEKDPVEDLQIDYPYCHCGADMRESEGKE